MKVDVNRANIRETPSTSASVVGQYYKGKPLKVHSIKNGWAKVGKFQFISVDLLKVMNAKGMVAKRSTKKKGNIMEQLKVHYGMKRLLILRLSINSNKKVFEEDLRSQFNRSDLIFSRKLFCF